MNEINELNKEVDLTKEWIKSTEKMAINSLTTKEYVSINTYLDSYFLDYLNECDLHETNCVNEENFADWFFELVGKEFPFASSIAIKALAREHAYRINKRMD